MVDFTFDGDPMTYRIEFDFNELADAEAETNCNLFAAMATWPSVSCRELRALLYALFKRHNREVRVGEVGTLLTKHLSECMKAVSRELIENGLATEADHMAAEMPADDLESVAPAPAN